ncbi:MAG: hypothetical protein QM516_06510, partial [Limnohabitans sp.]|nr:hypothetical protein [Limnohabitans sp.]
PATTPAAPPTATPDTQSAPASNIDAPKEEPRKRAYIVVDRISTAAGTIESDDDTVIVLRDEKGKIRSFTKSRVISVTYLLEGPSGRRVRVFFNDGRVLVAQLREDGYEHVVLEIEGIVTKYPRAAVVEVRPYPTDAELYEQFRTSLEPDQYSARYTLCLWLYNKRMYAESKRELESLLEATNHYEAKRLLVEVNAQLALMQSVPTAGEEPDSATKPTEEANSARPKSKLLSKDDVNLIRVYELDLKNPPSVQVSEALVRDMIEKYADHPTIPAKASEKTALYSKDPIDIVRMLFTLKARELYPQIEVRSEPESLNLFRTRVHNTWLINNCATSRCHGGTTAGRLRLEGTNTRDNEVRYTNLLTLLRTKIDTLPLVDFDKPTDSLLYQYALPATEARRAHPDVRGWSPALTSSRQGLREDFIRWVRSMKVRDGDYPVEFVPAAMRDPDLANPGGGAAGGPDR